MPSSRRDPHVRRRADETRVREACAGRVPVGCACLPRSVDEQRAARAARRDRPQVERALLVRGERDRAPVGRPGRLAVVRRPAREPPHALPIDTDRLEVVVRLRAARPHEPRSVGRPRRLHVLAAPRPREPLDDTGGDVHHVQLPVPGARAREREPSPRRRHGEVGVARLQPRKRDVRGPVRQHRGRAVAVHHDDRRSGAEPPRTGGTRHVRDHERERDEQGERHGGAGDQRSRGPHHRLLSHAAHDATATIAVPCRDSRVAKGGGL